MGGGLIKALREGCSRWVVGLSRLRTAMTHSGSISTEKTKGNRKDALIERGRGNGFKETRVFIDYGHSCTFYRWCGNVTPRSFHPVAQLVSQPSPTDGMCVCVLQSTPVRSPSLSLVHAGARIPACHCCSKGEKK